MPSNDTLRLAGLAKLAGLRPQRLRGIVGGLLAGALLLGVLSMLQDHLLYFPAKATLAEMGRSGLSPWPSPVDFRGLVGEPAGAARGTAIVFHGNAGHAGQRAYYAEALLPLGLRVILAEYPGYGPRSGAVGEASLVADASDAIEAAHREFGAPLIVIGESLGAGVAAAAVARHPDRVAGVLLITPWDRLERLASFHYPWLPVRWLLRDRYDSVAHLAGFGRPVLVVLAERDTIVPARFGRALYDALAQPKRLVVIEAAGHNDWLLRVDRSWWQQALDFLLPAPVREP
jgi:pimeloyl-ACP methyl ester carboxylesterase